MADSGEWFYDGRHYLITAFSDVATRDGYGWELEDVAPAPGFGLVAEAFYDDSTDAFTVTWRTERALPLTLVERFIREASAGVPPSAGDAT